MLSVKRRTALSLLFVAVIPICCILISFYQYNVQELRTDIEQLNISRVNQIKSGFESEIMSHYRLREVLCEDTQFLPLLRRGRPGDIFEASRRYREYLGYRDSRSDASIFMASTQQVLHRTGMSSAAAFFNSILGVPVEQAAFIRASILNIPTASGGSVIPVRKASGGQGLLCLYQLPAYSHPDIVLMVELSLKQVAQLFEPLLDNLDGSAFLLNSYGDVIFLQNEFDGMVESLNTIELDSVHNVLSTDIAGEQYSVIYSHSANTGLIYGVVVPESTYLTRVTKHVSLIWQISVGALILCVAAVLLLTAASYRPVRALLEMSGAKPTGTGRSKCAVNEYDAIRMSILDTQQRVERLTATMDAQRPYVLERLLEYIFTSKLSPQQASEFFEAMNLRFDYPCFFVMSLQPLLEDRPDCSAFKTAVIEAAAELAAEAAASAAEHAPLPMDSARCYCIERIDDDKLTIVVNCADGLERCEYVNLLRERINVHIQSKYAFTMGIGSLSNGYSGLKNSLYEANILVENVLNRPVSFSEEIETLPGNFRHLYPVKDMMLFLQQLRQGDEPTALESFDRLCDGIVQYAVSNLIFRHVCSYIVNSLSETARQLSGDSFQAQIDALMVAPFKCDAPRPAPGKPDASAGKQQYPPVLTAFSESAHVLIHDICQFTAENHHRASSRLRINIIEYVNENCTNPALSLESIAENFGLSPYYVSRFFRDQNNINLKDYIANLRIEHARDWLVHTELPVGDIVSRVGYQSASSFIRKFKLVTGLTPGKYRETYSHSPEPAENTQPPTHNQVDQKL